MSFSQGRVVIPDRNPAAPATTPAGPDAGVTTIDQPRANGRSRRLTPAGAARGQPPTIPGALLHRRSSQAGRLG